ncbi:MAG: hydrogenase maturation protease [Bacteroidales bacterium]|nr:hydrogenase maturation protease [Bacteroidales bacterium]
MIPTVNTVMIGFGSTALKDDGLPAHLIVQLATDSRFSHVRFLTSPVGGLELIPLISGYSCAVLLDTVKTGKRPPGELSHFIYPDFHETLHLSSQHDASFEQAMELGKKLGIQLPSTIHILAIEVEDNLTLGEGMSEVITGRFDSILREVEDVLLEVAGSH